MFINAIGATTKVANIPQPKEQPAFKWQNYAKVFETQYARKLSRWENVGEMYKELLRALASFKGANITPFFKAELEENGLLWALMNFTKYTKPAPIKAFEKVADAASKAPYPLVYSDDGQPLLQVLNHGSFSEENFISRLKNGEQRDVNLVFSDLADRSHKIIYFGHDYNTFDIYATRGTAEQPLKDRQVFYNTHNGGRLKQKIVYTGQGDSYISEKYAQVGTRISEDSFLDDFRRTISGW